MKKNYYFLPLLAALAITGCSSEDNTPGGFNEDDNNTTTSYMSVNLVNSDASDLSGARAAAGYVDGTPAESRVSSVRFYFFNGLGGAVNVKHTNSGYVNYYDWTPEDKNPVSDNDDVEKILSATIVINTAQGDAVPQRIAAVINPPTINGTALLPNTSMSLSRLKELYADFASASLTAEGKFVMYNSVGGKGTDLSTTLIEGGNLCTSEEAAKNNPVVLYVERSVAKVTVSLDAAIGFDTTTKLLKLMRKSADGKSEEYLTVLSSDADQQVYLKLEGWDLTAEASVGRLIKKVNPNWENTWWYQTHRSCWAINEMSAVNVWGTYDQINTPFDSYLYTNENAQTEDIDASIQSGAKKKTKVIIKGTLCDANGNPLTVVRHLGTNFADNANLERLKSSILSQLAANELKGCSIN